MKKLTNYTPGPRGVTLKSGEVVWIKPGATVEFENKADTDSEIVSTPDLGSKPAAEQEEDDEVQKQIADLTKQVDALTGERDALAKDKTALTKANADLTKQVDALTKPAK